MRISAYWESFDFAHRDSISCLDKRRRSPDGIVILGGDIDRVLAGIKLVRQYPTARIVFSGGNGNLLRTDDTTEADDAEEIFAELGVARERLLFDRQARNTRENAVFSKAMAQPKAGE